MGKTKKPKKKRPGSASPIAAGGSSSPASSSANSSGKKPLSRSVLPLKEVPSQTASDLSQETVSANLKTSGSSAAVLGQIPEIEAGEIVQSVSDISVQLSPTKNASAPVQVTSSAIIEIPDLGLSNAAVSNQGLNASITVPLQIAGNASAEAIASNPTAETASPVDPVVPPPSVASSGDAWVGLFKGSARSLSKKGTTFVLPSGESCVKIPNSIIEKNQKSWEPFIIGQFYSDPPPQALVHTIVNGIWSRQFKDISVSKLEGNAFLFRITNAQTRRRVLNQRLWKIDGQTMFVANWEPGVIPAKPELTSAPIWLELRDVPFQFFNEEGLERIASLVGDPKCLHPDTANKSNLEVAKVFTLIDPRNALPEAVNVMFDSGEIRRVRVSSPWMPPVCSHCKEIGHSIKRCSTAPITCKGCNSTSHSVEKCPRIKGNGARLPLRPKGKAIVSRPMEVSRPEVTSPKKSVQSGFVYVVKNKQKNSVENFVPLSTHSTVDVGEPSKLAATKGKEKEKPEKVKEVQNSTKVSEAGSDSSDVNSSEETEDLGKIWILWHPSVKVRILAKSLQMVTCEVKFPEITTLFIVSFVYASNDEGTRCELWNEICALATDPTVVGTPWVVLGDFNQTLCPSDHSSPASLNLDRPTRVFSDSLQAASLIDLTFRGCHFTWWNKRSSNPVAKKLDRVLVNDEWQAAFPLSVAFFEAPHWYSLNASGSDMFRVSYKLRELKKVIREFSKVNYSDLEKRVQEALSDLTELQSRVLSNPSPANACLEIEATRKWEILSKAEESFFYQKSRITWLDEGDKNTSFFHRMASTRQAQNHIHFLIDGQGNRIETQENIHDHCVDFFNDLLGSDESESNFVQEDITSLLNFQCTAEQRSSLDAYFSKDEIKAAFFSLPKNKASGPDGYPAEFFTSCWNVVGPEISSAVSEFFTSGTLLKQWNATSLVLIPKTPNAATVAEFRPISCLNTVYKVISRLLASRLQSLLPLVISHDQSAFLPGRLLTENVLLASEIVQGYNRSNISSRAMLKVDLRKAFDSVRWDFVSASLKALGLPERFIGWIMECVSTPSFSISINGHSKGYFQSTRGLRQGDPLSPYLFVLAMEVFSKLLHSRFDSGYISYHPKTSDLNISHLMFADDVMVFFDGSSSSLHGIYETLDDFAGWSGLQMNRDKTTLYHAGLSSSENVAISSYGFPIGKLPVRYLGLPLMCRKLRLNEYAPLLDKISFKFRAWAAKTLSFAGRVQLIASVIYGTINFWMSTFLLPKGCIKRIESLCSSFLWSGTTQIHSKAKVAWSTVCLPKNEGGLGLRNLLIIPLNAKVVDACNDDGWLLAAPRSDQAMALHIYLSTIPVPSDSADDDSFGWYVDDKLCGGFSASKTWEVLRPRVAVKSWASQIWFKGATPRHAFNMWVANLDRLPTLVRLASWGLQVSQHCCLCSAAAETREHLFIFCPFTKGQEYCISSNTSSSHCPSFDIVLMVLGTVGAIGDGMSTNVALVFASRIMNSLGYGQHNPSSTTFKEEIQKSSLDFVYLGLAVLGVAFMEGYCWSKTSERQVVKIRRTYLEAVLRQEVSFFDSDISTSEIIHTISTDTSLIQQLLSEKVPTFLMHISVFITGLVFSAYFSWRLTVVAIPTLVLLLIPGLIYGKYLVHLSKKSFKEYAKANSIVEQALSSIKTILSFTAETQIIKKYSEVLERHKKLGLKQGLAKGLAVGSSGISFTIWAFLAWYGSRLVMHKQETGGRIYAAGISFVLSGISLGTALTEIRYFSEASVAAARICSRIDRISEIDGEDTKKGFIPGEKMKGRVEFERVTFVYPSRPKTIILKDFSLTANVGQSVALMGASGSGKSTVIALLQRFYDPCEGCVRIDGFDIKTLQLKWMRRHIGVVSQDHALFGTSIRENLMFGKDKASMDEVISGAKAANAHGFITQLPNGYDTHIGDRGALLSGGQKQRIAIARAIIRNPVILLLDEATSALDGESETLIQNALDQVAEGRTTLVVAHTLSTVRGANIIAMLENGSVKELGSHEDLMTNNNHYAKLVNLQRQFGHEHRQDLQDRVKTPEIQQRWSTMNIVNRLSRRSSPDLIVSPSPLESINTAKINDNLPSTSFTRLLPLVSPEWKSSLVGCISAATFGAIQPVYALTIGGMISAFFAKSSHEMQAKIRVYSLIFTSLTFLSITLNLLQHYSFAKMGERLMQRLRLEMLEQIFTFEPAWFDVEENFSGELCSRLSNEVSVVKSLVADRISLLVQTISGVTIAMIIGLLLSWKLALVMIAVQPLSILCFHTKKVLLSNISHNYAYAQYRSSQIASEAIYNHKIVTSLGSTKKIIEIFDKAQYEAKRKGRKAAWLAGFGMGSAQCLTFLTWALDFWYGGVLVQKGEISAGDVFKTFFVLVSTGKVIAEAGSMTSDLAKGSAAISSVFKILDRPSSQENINHGAELKTILGRIELKHIDFSYPNRPSIPVLRQFSLDIKPGTSIGLVGTSGCGKSTVIALIQRFYDVEIGCVKIDSVDLRDIDIKWYRKHTALVSQEPVVYSGSIRDNIILGRPEATEDEVVEAARAANAHDFISAMEKGYETECGERGVQLSGGQKQRIAIARAFLRSPTILLLDEVTSSLDSDSEREVQDALARIMASRKMTTVVVAHRLNTLKKLDCIAMIADGTVMETGSYDHLKNIGGQFSRLVHAHDLKS
ncbi:ABC transporter type 1 transmembrane domain superfamily [Arabidopsis thaliana x Arabidopsis arenosa]|uniref:ABC transporter type 1 transmembrane domain superfamily n=1 Tax=Arabidopsis thaliana x Arabidopsis arenosa TaxID=1240361 RepID=A0A8T1ZLM5_9BRAS|nr:ABC transporter type 1 transmembrane domain superfamily [Arabidopsis thaliana x Arabidopsis arenosa]